MEGMEGLKSLPGDHQLRRRTVTRGAAWAIPAITVAGAAPAQSSSASCPPLPSFSPGNWAVQQIGATPAPTVGYVNRACDASCVPAAMWLLNNDAGTYTWVLSTTIPVQSGRTYTFTIPWFAYAANTDPMQAWFGTGPAPTSAPPLPALIDTAALVGSACPCAAMSTRMFGTATYTHVVPASPPGSSLLTMWMAFSITGSGANATGDDIGIYDISVTCD